jgi:hypothetical protein
MTLFGSELIKVGTEYTPLVSAANEARYYHTLTITLLSFTPGFSPVIPGTQIGEPFQRFPCCGCDINTSHPAPRWAEKSKPLKRFSISSWFLITGLKPGMNERLAAQTFEANRASRGL